MQDVRCIYTHQASWTTNAVVSCIDKKNRNLCIHSFLILWIIHVDKEGESASQCDSDVHCDVSPFLMRRFVIQVSSVHQYRCDPDYIYE